MFQKSCSIRGTCSPPCLTGEQLFLAVTRLDRSVLSLFTLLPWDGLSSACFKWTSQGILPLIINVGTRPWRCAEPSKAIILSLHRPWRWTSCSEEMLFEKAMAHPERGSREHRFPVWERMLLMSNSLTWWVADTRNTWFKEAMRCLQAESTSLTFFRTRSSCLARPPTESRMIHS